MGSPNNTDGGNHLPLIIKSSNSIVVPDSALLSNEWGILLAEC
jgi:hypothetical protein